MQFAPLMHESFNSLDISFGEYERETKCVRNYKDVFKRNRKPLFDKLGLDCSYRSHEKYNRLFMRLHEPEWINYLEKFQKTMLLEMRNHVLQTSDKSAIIRRYLKPLMMLRSRVLGDGSGLNARDKYIFDLFVELLVIYCEDSFLVADFLKLFSNSGYKRYIFMLNDARTIDYILYHAQKSRFDLWRVLPTVMDQPDDQNLLATNLFVKGSLEVLSTLIRYGAPIEKAVVLCSNEKNVPVRRHSFIGPGLKTFQWKVFSRREMVLNQTLHFATLSDLKKISPEDALKCIKLMWRSIPDIYPTAREFEVFMAKSNDMELRQHLRIPHTLSSRFMTVASIVTNLYEDNVSGVALYCHQPRSLQHLCRCVIRKYLSDCYQLPGGIPGLGLPKMVQKYLQLEW